MSKKFYAESDYLNAVLVLGANSPETAVTVWQVSDYLQQNDNSVRQRLYKFVNDGILVTVSRHALPHQRRKFTGRSIRQPAMHYYFNTDIMVTP